MPRASNRVADHQSFGERPVVVRARGADGKYFGASFREQNSFAIKVTKQHLAVHDIRCGNTAREIRAGKLLLVR
jgi:hypothetical protein